MRLKAQIGKLIRSFIGLLFRIRIKFFIRYFPIGLDPIYDVVKYEVDNDYIKTIVDVGANIGQSALKFQKFFSKSNIYSFEPINSTFSHLKNNCKSYSKIHVFNLALGATHGKEIIKLQSQSLNNSLSIEVQSAINSNNSQDIEIETLDRIMSRLGITYIDLLKIDTEGFDLEVLKGGINGLQQGLVKFIYCEVGFYGEPHKVDLHRIIEYLQPFHYRFVGLYETMRIGFNMLPAKFSNALFVLQE